MVAAAGPADSLAEVRAQLERIYAQQSAAALAGSTTSASSSGSGGVNGNGSVGTAGTGAARAPPREEVLEEALRIQRLLGSNTEELRSVVRALNGEYVLPEAGGDLLRDGAGANEWRSCWLLTAYCWAGWAGRGQSGMD